MRICFGLVLAALSLTACREGVTGPEPEPGVHISSGTHASDTILAVLDQPVVVEVRDTNLTPLAGVSVEFVTGPVTRVNGVQDLMARIRAAGSGTFAGGASVVTDERGRAAVEVQLGKKAGLAFVIASVSTLNARDSGAFTVVPGAPTKLLIAPRDTSVLSGGSFSLRAGAADSYGNPREDSVRYSLITGPAAVTPAGIIKGTAIGRAWIAVTSGRLRDSSALSVVPSGWLAAYRPVRYDGDSGGVAVFRTDGAQYHFIALRSYPPPSEEWFVWAPSAAELAYIAGIALNAIDTAGRVRQVVAGDILPASNQFPPEYSADGQWIYFTRGFLGSQQTCWRVRPDGTGLAQVSEALPWGIEAHPSPNPTDDAFVYLTNRATTSPTDFTLRIRDLNTQTVVPLDTPGGYPRWSPSGDRFAYIGNDGLLRTVKPNGTGVQTLGPGIGAQVGFSWSPDGAWIASVGLHGLQLVNAGTGEVLPLAYGQLLIQPSWLK